MRFVGNTLALAALLSVAAASSPATAAQADPAAVRIEAFDNVLLETMKGAKALGPTGRYRKLAPAVEAAFDMPTMTQFSVGPAWTTFTPAQKSALIAGFTRLSVASYAHNFDGYSGERFDIEPIVQTRGTDKIVTTHLVRPGAAPVNLLYRMRQSGGVWKIIDVYYGAISQLTTRRSDFARPLASGGADGLIAHLSSAGDGLLK
jgi:phospholipid transport system substrate-binding protein